MKSKCSSPQVASHHQSIKHMWGWFPNHRSTQCRRLQTHCPLQYLVQDNLKTTVYKAKNSPRLDILRTYQLSFREGLMLTYFWSLMRFYIFLRRQRQRIIVLWLWDGYVESVWKNWVDVHFTSARKTTLHSTWINWIMQCIRTVSYSYLVNDSFYREVIPSRGIRQGDPLSPYIFILCSEALSGLCKSAEKKGLFQGVRVARGSPRVSHLLFADDTMFFCLASSTNCEALMCILKVYKQATGQMINKTKSSITFSSKSPPKVKEKAKLLLGTTREGGLGKYLGLPEHFGRR